VPGHLGDIRYAEHDGGHLTYRMWGNGPPLLYVASQFIPIAAIEEQPAYERFLSSIATFATVIVFDRKGVGDSDPMRGVPTVEDWAAQLESVLDAAGLESTYLLGHGWGGLPTVTLAATRPERVIGLVLAMALGTPGTPGNVAVEEVVTSARPARSPASLDLLRLLSPTRADDVAFRTWWESAGRRGAPPVVAQQLLELQVSSDVSSLIPTVHVPTLVIERPSARKLMPNTAPFGADIAGARVVDVDGIDTLIWLPDSDAVVAEIGDFVTGAPHPLQAHRHLLTVMFTDVVASTAAAARLGDDRWRDVLDTHHRLMRAELMRHGGTERGTAGDGFLSTFPTPSAAARCAQRLHRAMAEAGVRLRVGIHCGEIEVRADQLAGIAVHIGARVQAKAEPGETWVTSTVKEVMTGSQFEFVARGAHDLKGVPGRWHLYVVES
jgi:class 3 adenylate cyclase/pimeloyl-ACP methyl ester carboxylesterase